MSASCSKEEKRQQVCGKGERELPSRAKKGQSEQGRDVEGGGGGGIQKKATSITAPKKKREK